MNDENGRLSREITWLQGTAMTIGAVIGAGILVLPALAAEEAGPASLVSWALMGLFTLPMLAAIAQMSSRFPNSGGVAAYAQQAFGPGMGRLAGFLIFTAVPIGVPPVALIGASYFNSLFGWGPDAAYVTAAAMALLASALNYRGVELSGRTQLCVVGAIVAVLLFVTFSSLGVVRAENFAPFAPHGAGAAAHAMSLLFFAFLGWEMIGHLAEEFKNPRRDIPRSLGAAFVIVCAVYLALAFVIVGSGVYRDGANTAMISLIRLRWGDAAASAVALLGFVMFGNVLRVSGVTERLSQAAQNEMANIVTILLGFSISAAMTGEKFVNLGTLAIIGMGLIAFVLDTAGGVITAKILNLFMPKDKKVNPMVGAAGISAFPMSARVIQRLGQQADPGNHLLMHAVGANVAGQIGSVLAGGILLAYLG